ncbi:hypothetical protein KFE25_010634 [Diacronema lutheri]|uniref:Uncharacterized protein n=1 Tax=Diacronema lutheri TaxID=2081491 RepID=A0A8J6CAW3_DIALT|nr:hypothetical protein KFE25_010634 [Diacronema lutheri]
MQARACRKLCRLAALLQTRRARMRGAAHSAVAGAGSDSGRLFACRRLQRRRPTRRRGAALGAGSWRHAHPPSLLTQNIGSPDFLSQSPR